MKQPNVSGGTKGVVILEKDGQFLADIKEALKEDSELRIIGERGDLPGATTLLMEEIEEVPAVIITGLDLLKEAVASDVTALMGLKEKMPGTRLIITSERYADEEIFRMIQEGIRGFFIKGTPPALIAKCIRVVLSGGMWMDNAFIARVFEEVSSRDEKAGA
ncbi:MAG: response regulator transcription factor [Deltaproteobacteria bacterium]|nr:response regulator transcription factor [Deltaproteobacteria bacterium]